MHSAEQTVFLIDDLRKEIFSYFRSKPHIGCVQCGRAIFWDPGKKVHPYVRMYNSKYWCAQCFRNSSVMYGDCIVH